MVFDICMYTGPKLFVCKSQHVGLSLYLALSIQVKCNFCRPSRITQSKVLLQLDVNVKEQTIPSLNRSSIRIIELLVMCLFVV